MNSQQILTAVTDCKETSDTEVAINDLSTITLHWRSWESSAKTPRT